jgi:bifunctional non-homologous end joining protein LigD
MFAGSLPAPMLPTLADKPFDSDDWLFELKWDGVRAVCLVARDRVLAVSRTGRDLMKQFPELSELRGSFRRLPVVVDGEIVSLDARGLSSFQRLQPRLNRVRSLADDEDLRVNFAVFDMLGRWGTDVREKPLEERKAMLAAQVRDDDVFTLLSKHTIGEGKALFSHAASVGAEGIVAKLRSSPYRSVRSREWLKIKAVLRQEFAVIGWTEPRGSRDHIGALLVGYYRGDRLTYAGHVGTGFDASTLRDLHRRLTPLETKKSPLLVVPAVNAPVHWVRPRLVAEIKFAEWTHDGVLRQPVYLGLRLDKTPKQCVVERDDGNPSSGR